jgi:hypothetical protein
MSGSFPQTNFESLIDPKSKIIAAPAELAERSDGPAASTIALLLRGEAGECPAPITDAQTARGGRFGKRSELARSRLRRLLPTWRSRPRGFLPADIIARWDEHRRLFIHIPKTAGTSLCDTLYGRGIKHRPAWEIGLFHPVRFAGSWKFAVVRDPIDRFLSAYDYLRAGGKNATDRAFGERFLLPHTDINAFVAMWRDETVRPRVSSYFHFSRQAEYISLRGRYLVNRLARFDHLTHDIERFFGHPVAIPEMNVTSGDRTPAKALSSESIAFLTGHYAQDFDIWRTANRCDDDLFLRPVAANTGGPSLRR